MPIILLFLILSAAYAAYGLFVLKRALRAVFNPTFAIIFLGVLIRLIFGYRFEGFPNDIACFKAWSARLFDGGLSRFYVDEGFADYPPVYMYVLYIIGGIRRLFHMDYADKTFTLLVKLPATICDCLTALFIYRLSRPNFGAKRARLLAFALILNPAVIMDTAVWGQVDSFHTLFIVFIVYYLAQKRLLPAVLLFAAAVLSKPQSIMIAPIFVFAFYQHIAENKGRGVITLLKYLGAFVGLCVLIIIPFSPRNGLAFDFSVVINRYIDTFRSYDVASANAYNVFNMANLNWKNLTDIDAAFLGIKYSVWGFIAIAVTSVTAFVSLLFKKDRFNFFLTAAFIVMTVFMFSVKMHERYCFPVLSLLLLAYVYKRDRRILYGFFVLTVALFVQFYDVYRMGVHDFDYALIDKSKVYLSFVMFAAYAVYMVCSVFVYKAVPMSNRDYTVTGKSVPFVAFERRDLLFVAAVTALYGVLAFTNLGNVKGSETFFLETDYNPVVFDFLEPTPLSRIQYFTNAADNVPFFVAFDDGREVEITENSVFRWEEVEMPADVVTRFVTIRPWSDEFLMGEFGFRGVNDTLLQPTVTGSDGADRLIDEQQYVPLRRSYMNSTYFDEIYHPRTAYEFLHERTVFEWTHPPLGKLIISLGIRLFGMTPFGWRCMGVLFGVLMVPILYVFAKLVLKNTIFAAVATVAFTFDFMHYAQTRLATIDTYVTFFVILMYLCMFRYTQTSYNDDDQPFRKTLIPLASSGLFMGLGIASKWPGMYAGGGLAVLFCLKQYALLREHIAVRKKHYVKYTVITLACCLVFFIVVPATIYVLSYIPYYFGNHGLHPLGADNPIARIFPDNTIGKFLSAIAKNSIDMFNYHAHLDSAHGFSSVWYEWILDIRPIWYYAATTSDAVRQGISAFGNPAVWWVGFVAFVYASFKGLFNKEKTAAFLAIAYLAQLLPWTLVSRTTYIYHYFPATPFLALMIGYMVRDLCLREIKPTGRAASVRHFARERLPYIYAAAVVLLFLMFYPVLTGINVNVKYVKIFLEWLPRWYLV